MKVLVVLAVLIAAASAGFEFEDIVHEEWHAFKVQKLNKATKCFSFSGHIVFSIKTSA